MINIKKIALVLALAFTGMQVANKVDGVVVTLGVGVTTAAAVTAGLALAGGAAGLGIAAIKTISGVLGAIF